MRIVTYLLVLIAAITADVPRADAGKTAGVTMPDTITVGNKQLTLNGMGLREATMFKVDVYVAGLYVERLSSDPKELISSNELKVLVLRFKRGVDSDDIVKAWNNGFIGNATIPVSQLRSFIDQLNSWMPSFKKGDVLAFTYVPGGGVAVDVNNVRKGVIKNDDFARSLFSIWLGSKPATDAVKRGLLGNHPHAGA
jgi:hypothetical protein